MSGRVDLINTDVVTGQLLGIPRKIREAIERKALSEANKLVVGQLRQHVPVETGALQKSLTTDIKTYKGGEVIMGRIGANYDYVGTVQRNKKGTKVFKKNKNATGNIRRPAKYLHLVELGTKRRQTKDGKNRGEVAAQRFREKTMEHLASRIQQILENAVQEALQ